MEYSDNFHNRLPGYLLLLITLNPSDEKSRTLNGTRVVWCLLWYTLLMFSIDNLLNKVIPAEASGEEQGLLTSKFECGNIPQTLYVLIPPWRGRTDYFRLVRSKIKKAGQSYLEYKISSRTLSSDHEQTRVLFEDVRRNITNDLEKSDNDYHFKKVVLIATSIGCVEALMVANNNPLVNKIILIAPGNCLAESLWKGIRTKSLRKSLEQKGVTLDFLKDHWRNLAPENNIEGLTGKELVIYLSKADKIIPFELGNILIEKMRAKGLNPLIIENHFLGHFGTVIQYLLRPVI